jgi:hypothetical protein
LIPVLLVVVVLISSIGDHSGNSNSDGIGDLFGGLLIFVATFVAPAFWSGALYVHQHEHER